jgi:hypothetical protein
MNALSSLYEKKSDTEVPSYWLPFKSVGKRMVQGMRNINNAALNAKINANNPNNDKEIEKQALAKAQAEMDAYAKIEKEALAKARAEIDAFTNRQSVSDNPGLPNAKPEYYIDSLEDQRGLYAAMNPDASVYHIDSMDKARNLFGLLNPGAEYITTAEHMWDDYVRRHPDLMRVAKDPGNKSIGGGNWLRGVKSVADIGQRHYTRHGHREGRTLRTPQTMYLNGRKVDPSELPTIGGYYFQDGTRFTNDMLPSYGYYDEDFRQVTPEKNSALLSIMANAQNPDAPRQEFYDPVKYPEMENMNPIAMRNMALRNNVQRRAPEAVYANNYLEWLKGQPNLMSDFEHNFNMSDFYGDTDEEGMKNLMSMYAKSKFDEGTGDKEMPQYRMEQKLPVKERYDGDYKNIMERLYQPVATTRGQRTLGGMDPSRGLAALLQSSPDATLSVLQKMMPKEQSTVSKLSGLYS